MKEYRTIYQGGTGEIVEKKSRFIATVTPVDTEEEALEFIESMKKLSPRERELIEYKFFKEKKLREISEEFNISQSRISRIIQSGLDKIKKDLKRQGII